MKTYCHALVLGLGSSGESAAKLLLSKGARVTVLDVADNDALRARADSLRSLGAIVSLGPSALPRDAFDICVLSPGIPADAPWVNEVRARGIELLPELEFGWTRWRGRTMAVTGTNGKSTAVKWIAESLQAAGLRAVPAGNYGPPASQAVMDHPGAEWLILEVSSFQLETIRDFRADAGVLLNLLPNHLDRHADMDAYARAKARLFMNARGDDACVVHEDQAARMKSFSRGGGRWISFGASGRADVYYKEGKILRGGKVLADLSGTIFDNEVLGCNAAGVIAALASIGGPVEQAVRSARTFKPLPHRMQELAVIKGVTFINDSKATTLTAMAAALRMCKGRARLMAGGLLKETEFSFIKEILAQKAAGIYLMGRASDKMAAAWSGVVPCVLCGTLSTALEKAWRDARAGETILLSPGCASFDQFRNYEDRGQQFSELVRHLSGEESSSCNKSHHGVC